jgi:hypothetical protein
MLYFSYYYICWKEMKPEGEIATRKWHFIWFWHTFSSHVLWRCLQELSTGSSGEDEGNKSRHRRLEEATNKRADVPLLFLYVNFGSQCQLMWNQFQCNRSICCLKSTSRRKSFYVLKTVKLTGSGCITWFHLQCRWRQGGCDTWINKNQHLHLLLYSWRRNVPFTTDRS